AEKVSDAVVIDKKMMTWMTSFFQKGAKFSYYFKGVADRDEADRFLVWCRQLPGAMQRLLLWAMLAHWRWIFKRASIACARSSLRPLASRLPPFRSSRAGISAAALVKIRIRA